MYFSVDKIFRLCMFSSMEVVPDKFRSRIIGISGVAGSGKDTFFNLLQSYLNSRDIGCIKVSLANCLKEDLRDFCLSNYKIDPTNCKRSDKNLLRPLMVFHGTTMRGLSNGRHWINKVDPLIKDKKHKNSIKVITDIRFNQYKRDEVNWLRNEIGGVLVHLRQYSEFKNIETGKTQKDFLHPANIYEEINDPQIRENADYKLDWKKVSDTVALTPQIRKFVKWMENKD